MASRFRSRTIGWLSIAVLACPLLFATQSYSQGTSGEKEVAGATWDSRFIPDDAFAVILASPRELLQNEVFKAFPIELLQVQLKETFGIEPSHISLVKLVLGLQEDGQPAFGIVLEMTQPFEPEKLLESLRADVDPNAISETATFAISAGPPGTVLHKLDEKTILLTLPTYLEAMLAANQGTGKLPSFVAATPRGEGINMMLALDSIRHVLSDGAARQAQALPPELLPLTDLPELIDTAHLNVTFNNVAGKLTLTMTGIDEDASERIDGIVTDGLAESRELLKNVIGQSMPGRSGSEEMQAAADTYAERFTKQIFDTISFNHSGKKVTLVVDTEMGVAGGMVIANFLMPMDRMIRSLTRQFDSSNNLRMVMLAMHNYHAAYNRLPGPAIMSADGKPLLSWRVALLPFIEEQALYEQFRLDEPWDSEHNLSLSKRLPKVYATAGVRLPPGQTVVHAAVGDEIGMRPNGNTGFRDFLDGTSNTIMILEANADSAVPWSKPADVEIDLEDPLANFKGSPNKSFGVGFTDGSVRRYPDDIDVAKFKALLTRAGGERVQP